MLNMLLKRNLLENITIISSCGTFICILLNYVTNISLITGIWFPLYICVLFIVSVFGSFKLIKWLLSLNRPVCSDIDNFVKEYPYFSWVKRWLPEKKVREKREWKEYDTNELSVISTVLERRLVSSWYVPYISQEISFPFACKQMLDQMIGKAFQICNNIESKEVFVDVATILTTHLKEYQKAIKRHQKSPETPIETLYKKSHQISEGTKYTSVDHCTNLLRVIIKELIPWELWDTPHSELIVRILSKRLDNYINNTLADPEWINDKIITYLTGEVYNDPNKIEKAEEIDSKELPEKTEPKVEEDKVKEKEIELVEEPVCKAEMEDVKNSPVLRQRRGRQGRNEVKIYDRIIEGSVKTWETDMDLQCISLGQDLLASLDGEITLSRLWGHEEDTRGDKRGHDTRWGHEDDTRGDTRGHDTRWGHEDEASPELGHKLTTHHQRPQWFGEEQQEVDLDKKESPKATEAILKDIQTTVSQAKTKIGDLQVGLARKHDNSTDEAAGMMEGLLDFGIAGLKKGLRFTGLSDDSQEKSPSHRDLRGDRSPMESHPKQPFTNNEHVLPKDDDVSNGVPHLMKQQRVTSQDSMTSAPRPIPLAYVPLCESPEPQYEEAADLSTSIAKLRSLLRQRAEAGNNRASSEVWWEGAEETRGRPASNTHRTSHVDTATLADEYDMSMDRTTSPNQTTNNMQRLDKLFQRTVTGVFNSLKTAVGGDEETSVASAARGDVEDWAYVTSSMELSVGVAAGRVALGVRSARVEAALDSLHSLHTPPPPPPPDDLEEWVCTYGRAGAGAGAVCAASALLSAHSAHQALAAIAADIIEDVITSWVSDLSSWLRKQVFLLFENMEEDRPVHVQRRPLNLDDTVKVIVDRFPAVVYVLGSETVTSSISTSVRSVSHSAINKDVVFRLLDLMVFAFHKAGRHRNPSFDAN